MIKKCLICNKEFNRPGKQFLKAKCCSRNCRNIWQRGKNNPMFGKPTYGNLGNKLSEESKNKIRIKAIGRIMSEATKRKISNAFIGRVPTWLKGKPLSEEQKQKLRISVPRGNKSPHWRGGFTKRPVQIKDWAKKVKVRDNFTCQLCGKVGGELHSDHIKPYYLYPELRFDLNNGRTLCVPCHRKTDTYGRPKIMVST